MHEIDKSAVKRWSNVGGNMCCPAALGVYCPRCGDRGIFTVESPQIYMRNVVAGAVCPACNARVMIVVIEPTSGSEQSCAFLGMYPAPHRQRQPIVGADLLPDELKAEYLELLETFNHRLWRAVVTQCRVALEGVVANIDPSGTAQLHQRLKDLASKVDLAEPIHKLADLLRKGGNTGAHFDPTNRPDEGVATAMLELLEYLVEYIYALPEMVKQLEEKLAKMPLPPATETQPGQT